MTKHQLRVQDALKFFAQKDTELGFRKLLDCVADTQQMSLYLKAIELTDWKENNPNELDQLTKKATALLEEIGRCTVEEAATEKPVLVAKDL